jgi:hypothetical protein
MVYKVFVSRDLAEAYRVRDALRAEGIAAEVTNEPLMGAWGEIAMDMTTMPAVWIADPDRRAEAAALVHALGRPVTADPWTCPSCGVENEGAFTACPSCLAERPAPDAPA